MGSGRLGSGARPKDAVTSRCHSLANICNSPSQEKCRSTRRTLARTSSGTSSRPAMSRSNSPAVRTARVRSAGVVRTGLEAISRVLADQASAVPEIIRGSACLLVEEIRLLEARIAQLERELAALARLSPACTTLLSIPGIGLLTATALVAATSGDVTHFKDARHFASWFGRTPSEHSSGSSRFLGKISKRGDRYLRMLLTHGARSVLRAAKVAEAVEREVCGIRRWALDVQRRSNHNKAACARANKLERICYATLRDKAPFCDTERLNRKITRESFVMPA